MTTANKLAALPEMPLSIPVVRFEGDPTELVFKVHCDALRARLSLTLEVLEALDEAALAELESYVDRKLPLLDLPLTRAEFDARRVLVAMKELR